MRLLVTGAAGFIGSNFVEFILKDRDDVQIVSMDSLNYAGDRENLSQVLDDDRHRFVKGDIRDKELVADLMEHVNVVVNFAAQSHVDRSIKSSKPFVSTNVQGVQTLLDAASKSNLDLFLQVSTDEVYGEIMSGTFDEDANLNPRNPYAATKASADLLAQSYYVTHNIPLIITRTTNNFGPKQNQEKLIPTLIRNSLNGKPLPLYGDGTNIREWLYVEDNCRAIATILEDGVVGEVYNIADGTELSNNAMAKKIVNLIGESENLITFVEDRPGHDQRYALDCSKLKNLGWEPQWQFEDALTTTIEHYQQQ